MRMRARCRNPNNPDFHNYGGRGISVCERWDKFENFFADMGKRPSNRHSIDRIDNDGNYEPGNCRWATAAVQSTNTRQVKNARRLTIDGVSRTIREWSEVSGAQRNTIRMRFTAYGWSARDSVFGK